MRIAAVRQKLNDRVRVVEKALVNVNESFRDKEGVVTQIVSISERFPVGVQFKGLEGVRWFETHELEGIE